MMMYHLSCYNTRTIVGSEVHALSTAKVQWIIQIHMRNTKGNSTTLETCNTHPSAMQYACRASMGALIPGPLCRSLLGMDAAKQLSGRDGRQRRGAGSASRSQR